MTDRIKDMVKERMDGVISGVKRIAVTDDAAMMECVTELADQLENATDLTEIETSSGSSTKWRTAGFPSMTDTSGEALSMKRLLAAYADRSVQWPSSRRPR